MYEFSRRTPLLLNVTCPSGSVEVFAEERENVEAEVTPMDSSRQDREAADNTSVLLIGDELTIEPPRGSSYLRSSVRLKIKVRIPIDSSAKIDVASAWLKCLGRYRDLNVTTASGEVEAGDVTGSARIRTSSGDTRIGDISGKVTARSSSADISVRTVSGSSTVITSSGKVTIASLGNDLKYKSGSGNLEIGSVSSGVLTGQSSSGDITVGVDRDRSVWLDAKSRTGQIRTDFESSAESQRNAEVVLRLRTASGSIRVHETR
ncbi:MAG: hypothetical protein CL731_02710 [Chloroflexi bacterium]|nr:hypothetical protein [Chloroflexota bacterium]